MVLLRVELQLCCLGVGGGGIGGEGGLAGCVVEGGAATVLSRCWWRRGWQRRRTSWGCC